MKTKQILTTKELAEVTGLTQQAIRNGINARLFPAFQINARGKFLIDYEEFQIAVGNLSRRNLLDCGEQSNVVSFEGIRRIAE
ncbi:MAG: hypothetical protein FWB87_15495 [Defluviitaleaceae bacterium]|nr:hypothetical protein [Defluviitaleaceae bacterium]